MLVVFADVGFDILQFFVGTLDCDALACVFVGFRIPECAGETDNLQLNCEIVPLIVIRPMMGTLPFCSDCLFR